MRRLSLVLLISILLSAFSTSFTKAQAVPPNITECGETVYALTTGNNLLTFFSDAPGNIINSTSITGLQGGETLQGLDFRPTNGSLYAVSNQSRIYTIDPATGAATFVATLSVPLNGTAFGTDFNPVPDRLRVVSDADQNLRINVDTGAAIVDGPLAYAVGDPNVAANPNVVGSAYTNNFAGATTTTLYGIDSNLDILVTQNPPNNGTLNTVGPLGFNTSDLVGFDIANGSTTAFASLTAPAATTSGLYTINLVTGAATLAGTIGGGQTVRGIAVAPRPVIIYGVTIGNNLIRFRSDVPAQTVKTTITGLMANEIIIGLDFRPANRRLYGVSNQSRIYTINQITAAATFVSTLSVPLNGTAFGVDFNPVPDRLRVVSDADQNLRINVDTGAATVDGPLAYAVGDPNAGANPNIVGAGYTNNFAGTASTTLYDIDSNLDILATQNPPNNGTLNTVGPLGVNTTDLVGFDIVGCDVSAYASFTLPGESFSRLYRVSLATGTATLIGAIGGGEQIRGIAAIRFDFCVQDDFNGNVFRFNSLTGEYQAFNCSTGAVVIGRGSLIIQGCSVNLFAGGGGFKRPSNQSVSAQVNACSETGSASVQSSSPPASFSMSDSQIYNNTCRCPAPAQ
jgi:hypothetical protein